jgi:hypothetical protein
MTETRPFSELRSSGLLWLINTSVLHPRGYALALHYDEVVDGRPVGEPTGWSIVFDGTERYVFAEEGWPEGESPDDAFQAIKELLP